MKPLPIAAVYDNDGLFPNRNLGAGRYEDVAVKAGLANPCWGTGANAAEFDNDGRSDLVVLPLAGSAKVWIE